MIEFEILEIKGSGDFIPDSVQEPDNKEYLLSGLQRMICFSSTVVGQFANIV